MPSIQYPIDTTGFAPTNLIVDEIHMLTEINSTTYRILIPEFAPLYLDNFELKHVDMDGNIATLVEDVDFHFCLPYIGGSRSIGKMIYGGITITNLLINGVLKLTYQTLGGEWTADKNYVMTRLAETVYNPRITVWDVVTNVQSLFPPINHDQSFDYVYGHQDLIASINDLAVTIANGPNPNSGLIGHFRDFNNPHQVTKEQVGLGLVENYPVAEDVEIQTKSLVNKYITLRQLVGLGILDLDIPVMISHVLDTNNPHGTTKSQLGLSLVDNYATASDQEVIDRTPVDKLVTLKQIIDTGILSIDGTSFLDHIGSLNNPHQVTKEQVGLGLVVNYPMATNSDIANKNPVDKYITLNQLLTVIATIPASTSNVNPLSSPEFYYLSGK